MKVIITAPTIIGGASYDPSNTPQVVPDNIGEHLVEIGNATPYEMKVTKPSETKKKALTSASLAVPVSEKKTARRRGKAKPK